MAWVFANLIKKGKKKIEDVPDTLLKEVKILLDKWGVEY